MFQGLHPLNIPPVGFFHCEEDPLPDILWQVFHQGGEVRFLQQSPREHEALAVVEVPHGQWLRMVLHVEGIPVPWSKERS